MDYHALKASWKKDEEMNFQGWNFSYLANRWKHENLPWDYKTILKKYLRSDYSLLDMGTGGGEFLLSLNHPYEKTSVTEGWEPNIKLCMQKLSPLGICVREAYNNAELPFENNSFDMVMNRHESYNAKEVKRILKPNGMFITQQVGGKNNSALSNRLIKDFIPQCSHLDLHYASEELERNSFALLYENEYFPYLHFYDVGAIVYLAKIIEWEFPGFSVDTCFDALCKMHEELKRKPYIESYEHRFIIAAKNIKA